jgi:SAM-dependent methyltransferase
MEPSAGEARDGGAAAFRFNFDAADDAPEESEAREPVAAAAAAAVAAPVEARNAARVVVPRSLRAGATESVAVPLDGDAAPLRFIKAVPPPTAALADAALGRAVAVSDVVPRVYEGGFKLWECALDLVRFLAASDVADGALPPLRGASVCELGCGHALPSAFCLQRGAARVVLQDLNAEVLELVAAPNLAANCGVEAGDFARDASRADARVRLVAGEWGDAALREALGAAAGFDLVLSSDTLYSLEAQPALADLALSLLRPGGVALFAAKRFYFGVGGSTLDFAQLLRARHSARCEVRVARVFENLQSNIRELLLVTRRSA